MPEDTRLTEGDAVHLLRRAGFGPIKTEPRKLANTRRSNAVTKLIPKKGKKARGPSGKKNQQKDLDKLKAWWLKRMTKKSARVHEKLVLFWHDHFPTSFGVIADTRELSAQNALFREFGLGSFWELIYQVTRDPAMLDYLDGKRNTRGAPNENYGRELMELFTLGPLDLAGNPNYTQQDVEEMARSLTGWRVDQKGQVSVQSWAFDPTEKVVFEGTGHEMRGNLGVEDFEAIPFPPNVNVIDALFAHRDSDGRPTLARYMAKKMWEWYAYPGPSLALVDELADVFVASGYVIADLLYAILVHDEFYSVQARESTAKTPCDFVVQTLLTTGAKADINEAHEAMEEMGMELFQPPGVEGWQPGPGWLSATRYLARLRFAQMLASGRNTKKDGAKFVPEKLIPKDANSALEIVDAMLALFHLNAPAESRQALIDYLVPIDLDGEDWIETKLRGLFVLLMSLPEFQVH